MRNPSISRMVQQAVQMFKQAAQTIERYSRTIEHVLCGLTVIIVFVMIFLPEGYAASMIPIWFVLLVTLVLLQRRRFKRTPQRDS